MHFALSIPIALKNVKSLWRAMLDSYHGRVAVPADRSHSREMVENALQHTNSQNPRTVS